MPSVITVCDTCKRADWEARQVDTTDGETFAATLEAAAEGIAEVRVRRHSCLMGCGKGCNLAIQARGKLTYVLGDFQPGSEAAKAVVEYARLHAQSKSGQVPFKQWPQAIKGHFVSRLPALAHDTE